MYNNPVVVLCGRKRTGKETTFKILAKHLEVLEFQFSTPLKKFCMDVLGLTEAQCYGNDLERESPTQYKWGESEQLSLDLCKKYNKTPGEFISARNILQIVGTDLVRNGLGREVWAKAGIRQIKDVPTDLLCTFTDTRFPNEVLASKEAKWNMSIRLYRDTGLDDGHSSETALDSWDVIPNQRTVLGMEDKLRAAGYYPLTKTLWRLITSAPNKFDYLLDNNGSPEDLEEDLKFFLPMLTVV